jgi:hypothetical protein
MAVIDFKFGTLIRAGQYFTNGGKWDAELIDEVRNDRTNADLTITISVSFRKIDPKGDGIGQQLDSDNVPRPIQKWAHGEFEAFKAKLLREARRFWNGVFWLRTPTSVKGLDWPDRNPTHRCNLYCKLQLQEAIPPNIAHYEIDVVRVKDGNQFRSHSRLYSQNDIKSENLIRHSTVKFWTHFHEVGHLLGLGHVNHHDIHRNGLNSLKAYGVTKDQMQDVMGKGSRKHLWHAVPWQEAAATFTDTKKDEWQASFTRLPPVPLSQIHRIHS